MPSSLLLQFAYPVGFPVINFDTVISLAHWSTSSFYHGIIELVPMFFVFSHLPRVFKSHPIAVELFTVRPARSSCKPVHTVCPSCFSLFNS